MDAYYGRSSTASFLDKIFLFLSKSESPALRAVAEKSESRLGPFWTCNKLTESHHLSVDGMLKCLEAHFFVWSTPFVQFLPEKWLPLIRDNWESICSNTSGFDHSELLCIYLIISLGAHCFSFNQTLEGYSYQEWASLYRKRAMKLFPNILTNMTIYTVQALVAYQMIEYSRGNYNSAYIFCGMATRIAISMGLHNAGKDDPEAYVTWVATYISEKHSAFLVGRPSSLGDGELFPPLFPDIIGRPNGRFTTGSEHEATRLAFGDIALRLQTDIYATDKDRDISSVYLRVNKLASEIDIYAAKTPYVIRDRAPELQELSDSECREWFWLRLYYLHLRMVLYRPFLIFLAYIELEGHGEVVIPQNIRDSLVAGAEACIQIAIEVPTMILSIGDRLPEFRCCSFWTLYLEASCAALLFFIITKNNRIEKDMALRIWISLSHAETYLDSGLGAVYCSSSKIVGKTLSTLRDALESSEDTQRIDPTEFASIFFGQTADFPKPKASDSLKVEFEIDDLNQYWLQMMDTVENF